MHWWQSYLLIRRKLEVLKCIAENDLEDFSALQAQELWPLGWELCMVLEHLEGGYRWKAQCQDWLLEISAPSEAVSLASGKVRSHFEHRRYWIVIQHCFEWPDLNLHASIATTLLLWHCSGALSSSWVVSHHFGSLQIVMHSEMTEWSNYKARWIVTWLYLLWRLAPASLGASTRKHRVSVFKDFSLLSLRKQGL